jgi:putative transcriptional regulator
MKAKTESRVLEAVHTTAQDPHAAGFIDKRRMRHLDALCLEPIPAYTSDNIRVLHNRYKLSQSVLTTVFHNLTSSHAASRPSHPAWHSLRHQLRCPLDERRRALLR